MDVGLGVISSIAELDSFDDLTLQIVKETHSSFEEELLDINSRIKSFSMIFTTNSLLTNPSIKSQDIRRQAYQAVLNHLLQSIGAETRAEVCESCGNSHSVDFNALCAEALEGIVAQKRFRSIGRDWFPLAGSLGSDAQALPAASRSPNLCAKCLFAVHYLPLGLILINGRLAAFQSTSSDLWYYLIDRLTQETIQRTRAGDYSTQKSEGQKRVIFQLLDFYEEMLAQSRQRIDSSDSGYLFIWRFSNAGPNPDCEMEILPNSALSFLKCAVDAGLRSELFRLVSSEKNPFFSLHRCLIDGRDYLNLYPSGKRAGASPALFHLYQTTVLQWSELALDAAERIAQLAARGLNKNQLKKIQKEEAFRSEPENRAMVKKAIIEGAQTGETNFKDYNVLFPRMGGQGVRVAFGGWELIRYYLHHIDTAASWAPSAKTHEETPSDVALLASAIYDRNASSPDRLLNALSLAARRGAGASWLRQEFVHLAEDYKGFTFRDWKLLVETPEGRSSVGELLFQLRLLLVGYLHQGRHQEISRRVEAAESQTSDATGLPSPFSTYVQVLVDRHKERTGIEGVQKHILQQLARRRIGLTWFKHRFNTIAKLLGDRFNEEIWEKFLRDEDGNMRASERLFQIHLAVANSYRRAKASNPT